MFKKYLKIITESRYYEEDPDPEIERLIDTLISDDDLIELLQTLNDFNDLDTNQNKKALELKQLIYPIINENKNKHYFDQNDFKALKSFIFKIIKRKRPYQNIALENYVYNEADYDLKDFPMVLKNTTPEMLTSELKSLIRVLRANINNKKNVGNIEVIGQISRTLMKMQGSFDATQESLQTKIQKLMKEYEDFYGKS
jgi:hypothetical protein